MADRLEQAMLSYDKETVRHLLVDELADVPFTDIMERLVTPVLANIGEKWRMGVLALSQIYLSAKVIDDILDEMLSASGSKLKHNIGIAAVCLEDYHLLGIHVVKMVVRSGGHEVLDYGRMELNDLVERVCRDNVHYLLVSTLMLRSALRVRLLREMLEARGCYVCIIVGGAPFRFDASLCSRVRADFTSTTPSEALKYIEGREGMR
jgi:methanogenic corrinoid protein MtbC1